MFKTIKDNLKNKLIYSINKLIQLIEKYEFKEYFLDENDINKKIINSYDFQKNDYFLEADDGWQSLSKVFITQPYTHWRIETESGKSITCADNHILFNENFEIVLVKDLKNNDLIVTNNGIEKIKKCHKLELKTSMFDVEIFSDNHRYFTNDILSHNTVTAGIFICHYMIFNSDKNIIVLANKADTAGEILDKMKTILKGLPFFLKPGMIQNNIMTMKFDNGCKIMGKATTKTAAIGFTIHLAFMDEFAHIQPSFLEPFYRSVYPTISASEISRVIITSTPSGRNKFYEIYQGALEKRNEYVPLRVDWWEVPGRDEAWKQREIANLGSEELFNQEYGNQFLSSERLLLSGNSLRMMRKMSSKYRHLEIIDFEEEEVDYKDLKWHPLFSLYDINDNDKFIFSIDIADGAGQDYSVINIFKIDMISAAGIRTIKLDRITDETSFFRLKQIGLYRSNKKGTAELSKICEILLFKVFNPDNVRVCLEVNFKGDYFIERLSRNRGFYEDIFLHTRHNEKTNKLSLGIKLHKQNKMFYCREFKLLVLEKKIILNEKNTINEMNDFGINSRGVYSSQSGHDDIAMTCVNLIPLLVSYMYTEMIEEIYDEYDSKRKELIQNKLSNIDETSDNISLTYLLSQ